MNTDPACTKQVCMSNQLCCRVALHWVLCCQSTSWMGMSSELALNLGNSVSVVVARVLNQPPPTRQMRVKNPFAGC